MSVKYVVSIAGALLYFDAARKPTQPLASQAGGAAAKPGLQLIPPAQRPAASPQWDAALGAYSTDQRNAAEISEVP